MSFADTSFADIVKAAIADHHLLSHPFYQAWQKGELTQAQLQNYAVQYNPFVEAFPRFVSALHSNCEDAAAREEILENLMDEEGKTGRSAPHPQLWHDFMAGLGATDDRKGYDAAALQTKATFLKLCQSSYAEGLCALYAYEYQTPEISKTKTEGLKKFYGIDDEATLAFFQVHEVADIYHSKSCEALMNQLPVDQQPAALAAAKQAADSLWNFLTAAYGDAPMAC